MPSSKMGIEWILLWLLKRDLIDPLQYAVIVDALKAYAKQNEVYEVRKKNTYNYNECLFFLKNRWQYDHMPQRYDSKYRYFNTMDGK